jgi:broad specificity phosphatase PhoE
VSEHKPPDGESSHACALRFEQALINLSSSYAQQNILIVSHGDIMRCFLSYIGLEYINGVLNQYNNGCLIAIIFDHQSRLFSTDYNVAEFTKDYA